MSKSLYEIYLYKNKPSNQIEYDKYLSLHIANVQKTFEERFLPYYENELSLEDIDSLREQISHHDDSKTSVEEYQPYVDKFYPDGSKSEEMIYNNFAYAWLHHLHNNPHHPQYWYLRNDTDHSEDRVLDIPFNYIVEMLCDWGSFYYMDEEKKPGINPNSRARDWYNLHGEEFGFSDNTKNQIEKIFDKCLNL